MYGIESEIPFTAEVQQQVFVSVINVLNTGSPVAVDSFRHYGNRQSIAVDGLTVGFCLLIGTRIGGIGICDDIVIAKSVSNPAHFAHLRQVIA